MNKYIEDKTILKFFEEHDAGKNVTEIYKKFEVSKAYVSFVLRGKKRLELKNEYEKKTGKPFSYIDTHSVDRNMAKQILKAKYKKGKEKTCVELADEFDLNVHQVRTIVTGKTASDTFEKFKEKNDVYDNFKYSETQLLNAFDLRFKKKLPQDVVAERLGISKAFLSTLFHGKDRLDIKEKWEFENGKIPSIKEIKSEAAKLANVRKKSVKRDIKIQVYYPSDLSFTVTQNLPIFKYPCKIRTRLFQEFMQKGKYHDLYHHPLDYIVEDVEITDDGELWHIGS